MATLKIINPQVVGKLKLPSESASKALTVNASGDVTSSAVTLTELALLSGVTSALVSINGTQTLTNKTLTAPAISSPTGIVKADVGLANVPNVDATARANHTGTQLAATISDFTATARTAAVADSITDAVTNIAPSQNAVFDALALKADASALANYVPLTQKGASNGVATLDAGGKVPVSQLPNSVMEFKGVFDPATATFTDASGNAGDVYLASVAGSYNAGSGSITYAIGDWAVHNGTVFQKSLNSNAVVSVNGQTGIVVVTKSDVSLGNVDNTSDATKNSAVATLTNKTLTAPVINSPTGIVKGDVGLANVDNTSDATKNAATATLTNKTINAANNTISNLNTTHLASGVLDTDLTSVSGLDDTIPSAKAVKSYADSLVGSSGVTGDINNGSFAAANNVVAASNVTGFAFAAGSVRSFRAIISVSINATTGLNEVFDILGIQRSVGGFDIAITSAGDDSGVVFSITSAGQIQYVSQNSAGFVSNTIKFRAQVTNV